MVKRVAASGKRRSGVLPAGMSRAVINSATVGTGTTLSFVFGYWNSDPLRKVDEGPTEVCSHHLSI